MKRLFVPALIFALAGVPTAFAETPAATALLSEFKAAGAGPFNAQAGKTLWEREFVSSGEKRSCTACHNAELRKPGKHATTGKVIDPLAPSVNSKRLTDRAEIEKWFVRNCKWTLGRLCSPQEKGDVLTYLQSQ